MANYSEDLRVVGYVRVSTLEQSSDGNSLEVQRARIEAWCEAANAHLTEVVEDAAVSGSRPLDRRPGGQRIAALLDARTPEVDAVVVCRLDRLGRNAAENLAYLRRFAKGRVGLVSLADRLDLSSAPGRAMAAMASVFAELEREMTGERTRESLARLREQGFVTGATPYGFRRRGKRLEVDADEARWVTSIIEDRNAGMSFRQIAQRLNDAGVRAKRGGAWTPMSVRSVLITQERRRVAVA